MKKVQMMDVTKLIPNENNPRIIRDEKFKKLVQSIKDFPEMLELRPIVVNKQMVVLGGNMRLRACIEAGIESVPVIVADSLTPEQEAEFIIKDNVGFGEWDWDILANQWENQQLSDWGLDVFVPEDVDLDKFFETQNPDDIANSKFKIVLEYTEEEFAKVTEAFARHGGSKENVVAKLLGV